MGLIKTETQFLITFGAEGVLGEVNVSLEAALKSVAEQQYLLEYEVFAPVRAIRETISQTAKEKDAIVRVQINIYGPRNVAQAVGRELSQQKVYLQHPDHIRAGSDYDNPHVLKLSESQLPFSTNTMVAEERVVEAAAEETLKSTVKDVYASLTRDKTLQSLEGDERLKTSLLPHQKTALDFMTQRENGPIQEAYRLWRPAESEGQLCHRHAVTNSICRMEPPEETGGGILADEVCKSKVNIGLGYDILMIIRHFADTTLNALRMIKYHGENRERSLAMLCDADMVITTYHTLAAEMSNDKSLVSDIEWYRLVLDEAHIIRRQSTGLYRTVANIVARSRWCLTGTPIQNRLEDIGSLLAFLRIEPFHSLSTFRKYIALPFEEGTRRRKVAVERFTRLLDSLCLRRTKDLLQLPEQHGICRSIKLSVNERKQYDQTKKTMVRAIKHQHGVFDQKSTLGLFQVQLQLRIICNHGTWQQSFSWNRRKLHLLDEREAMEASFGREGEKTCSACRQTMPLFGTGTSFQQYQECRHVLCSECVEESMPQGEDVRPTHCPLCSSLWHASTSHNRAKHTSQEDMYFRSSGFSSKMEALMADVMQDVWTTKR
ncbi:hypothetical protein EK21DRAFT_77766 [Setomelanomma holmii]|uniref:Helicase ATP-binding domain-containing protein n=1 Tax=Setomelanomma holmii TaxID=210430 RepID=A0A9P4H0B5_9PLEO|nr:hypothetical protein EK21DRAFT_77766 [Setomelanomma holmii]